MTFRVASVTFREPSAREFPNVPRRSRCLLRRGSTPFDNPELGDAASRVREGSRRFRRRPQNAQIGSGGLKWVARCSIESELLQLM